MWCVLTGGEWR